MNAGMHICMSLYVYCINLSQICNLSQTLTKYFALEYIRELFSSLAISSESI